MYTGDINETIDKAVAAYGRIKTAAKDVKGAIASSISKDVAPKVALTTALAAVLGSAVMLGLVWVVMRKKRRG